MREELDLGGDLRHRMVVLVDFGVRGDAGDRWAKALEGRCERLQVLVVGSEPEWAGQARRGVGDQTSRVMQVFTGVVRGQTIEAVGAAKHQTKKLLIRRSPRQMARGLQLQWGSGWTSSARTAPLG